jgi:DNA (cytosine-5)-methyltransferase 1
MKHIGLFEGIGGFSVATKEMGWETVAWCEWDRFCQMILKELHPEAEGFSDIKKADFTKYADRIDILTGGFPCQPFSLAGKRKGTEDDRHLWPEMLRAIREIRPPYVVGENVRGLVNWDGGLVFEQVQIDLEAEGYEVIPFILPACGVDAPHRRDRVWFVGYTKRKGLEGGIGASVPKGFNKRCEETTANTSGAGQQKQHLAAEPAGQRHHPRIFAKKWSNFPTQSPICTGNDGFSAESLRQRIREDCMGNLSEKEIDKIISEAASRWRKETIKAAGNAIVPQVFLQICKVIQELEKQQNKTYNFTT